MPSGVAPGSFPGDRPAVGAARAVASLVLAAGLLPGTSALARAPGQGIDAAPAGRAIYGTPVVTSTRELGTPAAVLSAPAGVIMVQQGAWGHAQQGGAWGQVPPSGVTRIVPNVVPGWGGQPAPAYGAPGAQQAPLWGPPWVPPPNVVILPPGTILPPGYQLPPGVIIAPGVIPGQAHPGFAPR